MGISLSKNETEVDETISTKLDYLATYYIFTSNFESLKELYKKEYCDDLIILTSDIIQKNLSYREVEYMQSRVLNGEVMETQPMAFFSKSVLEKENNEKNKTRMCIGIAKFYIKVAHIFAAIITSVNPSYTYVEDGIEKMVSDKRRIPDGATIKEHTGNLCQRRLEALTNGNNSEP